MDVLLAILNFFLQWYIWLPIVIILAYLTWRNYSHTDEEVLGVESALLVLEIPKANDKKELAAEQLFASLHGILRDSDELRLNKGIQEHIGFEIASINGQIRFYCWVPKPLRNFVEGQIYSQYPTVQIHEAGDDYVSHDFEHEVIYSSDITLTDNQILPIKTFQSFEVDPLAGITGALAKLESTGDEVWIQILARPIADDWHKVSDRWIKSVKKNGSALTGTGAFSWAADILQALWKPPEASTATATAKEVSERDRTRIAEAEKKATKLGYQVKIRLIYLGENITEAQQKMQAIVGTFKQFNSTNLNGFRMTNASFSKDKVDDYRKRRFNDEGFILNIEELASVYHLPHTNVETPNVVWANSKNAEPPSKLPVITGNPAVDENISAFGITNFRGINHQFGILRSDRSRHIYVIGQTGTGKTGTLALLALSDIFYNHGYAIIDPHGDFAVDNMRFLPGSRLDDVIYFNPSDTAFPIGFNPLEVNETNAHQKNNISSEVIGVLKRMFGDSWGPRMEHILRYTILALLDRPNTTMLDITRMLTDKAFRKDTLSYCQDAVVKNFWRSEFDSWNDKFATEAVAPVLNKVGAFTANPIIRNIIGQPKSTFNIRQIMDDGKILIVNLSKGLIGEDNAAILGSFLVTKIQLAAMSRSDIADIKDRKPFYLYVDEFQNFATDSFAVILSEARKYGLNLAVANQYISQMSETVRDAVFGNVGTIICFRVSADDAPALAKQFEPQFEPADLLQMNNRHFVINMVINGEKSTAFNAKTLEWPPFQEDNTGRIIENTRKYYTKTREEVEQIIEDAINQQQQSTQPPQSQSQAKQWPIEPQQTRPQFQSQPAQGQQRPTGQSGPPRPSSGQQSSPRPPIKLPEGIKLFSGDTNTGAVGDKATVIPSPVRTEANSDSGEVPKKRHRPRRRNKSGGSGENNIGQSNNGGQAVRESNEPRETPPQPARDQAPKPQAKKDDSFIRIQH